MRLMPSRILPNNKAAFQRYRRKHSTNYIIERTNCLKPQFYRAELDGYCWTTNRNKATQFQTMDMATAEVAATKMWLSNYFTIVPFNT